MTTVICFIVALFACTIGKICGMGGGVIIKPVLDAMRIADTSTINFISGCTVLGMSCCSVITSARQKGNIDFKVSTPLAIGAAAGGIAGKFLFSAISGFLPNSNMAGGIQAVLLLTATAATLIYTIKKETLRSLHVSSVPACIVIGLGLGMLGSFLGIGGGPFNMAVLFLFFSMDTKTAAQNSLYIILISQLFGITTQIISTEFSNISLGFLTGMVILGIIGSEIGAKVNKRLSERSVTKLFEGAIILVVLICVYNIIHFFGS